MKKALLLLAIPLILIFKVNGQRDFRPGYIITIDNEKITGEIDNKRKSKNSQYCYFRKTKNDSIIEYSPFQINEYCIENIDHYFSKVIQIDSINLKRVFLETLISGKINLYGYFDSEDERFYIERDSIGRIEIPYKEYNKKEFGRIVLYRSNIHTKILMMYMADCPLLKKDIQNIYRPDETSLIKLIRKYHNLTDGNEKNIVYIKKLPHIAFSIIPTYKYQSMTTPSNVNFSIDYLGVLLRLGNIFNERLFLRTGILYANHAFNIQNEMTTFQIPILIFYLYPKYKVKPYIGAGSIINIYNNKSYSTGGLFNNSSSNKYTRNNFTVIAGIGYEISRITNIFAEFGLDFKTKITGMSLYNSSGSYNKFNIQMGLNIKLF